MTYAQQEASEHGGYPIEIFKFQRDASIWRYTSADEDKLVEGHTFEAIPMSRSTMEQSLEMARSNLTIKMYKNAEMLLQFRASPPTSIIYLQVRRYHEGVNEYVTTWLGRVTNVKFSEREAEVRCEPSFTSLKRPVLRLRYQTTCPHVLYGTSCRVNRVTFQVPGTILANNGTTVSSTAFAVYADGYFTGGYIDWNSGYDVQRRFIVSHASETIGINLPFAGIQGGDSVVAYPGCDHLLTTCNSKFLNVENYGGQPFYPGKNPFIGTPIF